MLPILLPADGKITVIAEQTVQRNQESKNRSVIGFSVSFFIFNGKSIHKRLII